MITGPDDMPAHINPPMFWLCLTSPLTDGHLNMGGIRINKGQIPTFLGEPRRGDVRYSWRFLVTVMEVHTSHRGNTTPRFPYSLVEQMTFRVGSKTFSVHRLVLTVTAESPFLRRRSIW